MDRSSFSNVVATIRLLEHFPDEELNALKQILIQQLGCADERQFLCKVLSLIYKSLSEESITILKNKAMKIAENTLICDSFTSNCNNNNNNREDKRLSIYTLMQKQSKDNLSQLPSDTIDHLGSYLSKKQSIEFGYLNRQLYIESQKYSYLLKRHHNSCNDEDLSLIQPVCLDFYNHNQVGLVTVYQVNLYCKQTKDKGMYQNVIYQLLTTNIFNNCYFRD